MPYESKKLASWKRTNHRIMAKEKSDLEISGHIWIPRKILQAKLKGVSIWSSIGIDTRLPFFQTLNSIVSKLRQTPEAPALKNQFLQLMNQAKQEVPILDFRFEQGIQIIQQPIRIKNELECYADSLNKPF